MDNNFADLAHDFVRALSDRTKETCWPGHTFTANGLCRAYIINAGLAWWLDPFAYGDLTFDYHYQYRTDCGNNYCHHEGCGLKETGTVTVYDGGQTYSYTYDEYGEIKTA